MWENAFFIRGLLDPCEEELICTANDFAMDYKKLLEEAKRKDCEITGLILPLLADHVLREANHYLRILEKKAIL